MTTWVSSGSGPGVITPDGCAVDFYALCPPGDEPQIVHAAVADEASILELGCGAGRVTGPLAALGHRVTAVDESAEMLALVRDAQTVQAGIEELDLGRRFGAVLLASHLVNVPDEAVRQALLASCARHVAADGCVVIQQHQPAWFDAAGPAEQVRPDGMIFRLRDVSRPGPDLLSATVEYEVGDRAWTQSFTAGRLSRDQLDAALSGAGLAFDRYLTDDESWLRAVPGPPAAR
jgi:SAM-dependent methyltransferase